MSKTRFGFWPRPWHIAAAGLSVEPVADCADVVEFVNKHERAFDGWMHPPLGRRFSSALGLSVPWMPATAYNLPSTHELSLDTDDEALADFSIALIGLLDGMLLVREGWNHFYKTPIEPAKLVDFVCTEDEMSQAVDMATRRWRGLDRDCQKWMLGAIHWYCFTAAYEHQFERFGGLYIVLDTLYRIHVRLGGSAADTRAEQAAVLADAHRIPLPDWAQVHTIDNKDVSRLSTLRNEFFHEGRYGGKPIGFDAPEENITLEFEAFVTRVILGMLSVHCAYVRTPATTQQRYGLDVS